MSESGLYKKALEAAKHNQRVKAREMFTRLLREEKQNIDYWLWLSSLVDSDKERSYCLQTILRLDPDNTNAQRGLRLMGELPNGDEIVPVPPTRRIWEIEFDVGQENQSGLSTILANPWVRIFAVIGGLIVVFGLLFGGMLGPRGSIFGRPLTVTPVVWTPTASLTPSATSDLPSPTPQNSPTPQPLWMQLDATYTPRPPFVNTPHPRSEAYRIAIRSYQNGDYENMLNFMEQVLREEPEAADVYYFIGEGNRLLGEYDIAIQSYQSVLEINQDFAPAYLGRALAQLGKNPEANIVNDLQKAIALEPNYADAHLEFASYQFNHSSPGAALEVLQFVEGILVDNPRYYQIRARAELALGMDEEALNSAIMAYDMDVTDLAVYLILGEAYLENDQIDEALDAIRTYGQFEPDTGMYWALLGRVHYELESYDEAYEALEKALEFDDELAIAHQYFGLTALAVGEANEALNELVIARNLRPGVFDISLGLARAFLGVENVSDAYLQINATEDLAQSDEDLAKVYYYRAQIAHELSQFAQEKLDWQALLDLPEEAVPEDWREEADLYFNPPTETPTPTITFTPSATPLPETMTSVPVVSATPAP